MDTGSCPGLRVCPGVWIEHGCFFIPVFKIPWPWPWRQTTGPRSRSGALTGRGGRLGHALWGPGLSPSRTVRPHRLGRGHPGGQGAGRPGTGDPSMRWPPGPGGGAGRLAPAPQQGAKGLYTNQERVLHQSPGPRGTGRGGGSHWEGGGRAEGGRAPLGSWVPRRGAGRGARRPVSWRLSCRRLTRTLQSAGTRADNANDNVLRERRAAGRLPSPRLGRVCPASTSARARPGFGGRGVSHQDHEVPGVLPSGGASLWRSSCRAEGEGQGTGAPHFFGE